MGSYPRDTRRLVAAIEESRRLRDQSALLVQLAKARSEAELERLREAIHPAAPVPLD